MLRELPSKLIWPEFHSHSKPLFSVLVKAGEIDRQKRFEQLGIIAKVFKKARHPRWEYMAVTMHLMDLARKHVQTALLASSIKIGEEKISKTELMKIWTLLLGSGHLPWTFIAEKEFLCCLCSNKKLRQEFEASFSNPISLKIVRKEINNQNPYHSPFFRTPLRRPWAERCSLLKQTEGNSERWKNDSIARKEKTQTAKT